MQKILIVGENSYLANDINFDKSKFIVEKIKRPFCKKSDNQYSDYDFIINFCIQPEHFFKLLPESEMIDVEIAKQILDKKTKYVFLSSRKIYGSDCELKYYDETCMPKPYDFYSKNKLNIEQNLANLLNDRLVILRTGNIIGNIVNKQKYNTFVGWIYSELEQKRKVI